MASYVCAIFPIQFINSIDVGVNEAVTKSLYLCSWASKMDNILIVSMWYIFSLGVRWLLR
jgi:hypothetical protein